MNTEDTTVQKLEDELTVRVVANDGLNIRPTARNENSWCILQPYYIILHAEPLKRTETTSSELDVS